VIVFAINFDEKVAKMVDLNVAIGTTLKVPRTRTEAKILLPPTLRLQIIKVT
jgi:hypothetical protein